jgi:hypothetical protein
VDLDGAHYQDVATVFVGGVVLLCASLGVLRARADHHARIFTALAVFWIVYAYDIFGVSSWLGLNTRLGHIPVTRAYPLWAPSACFLAALGVSALERSGPSAGRSASAGWLRGLSCLALAAGLLALFHWGAQDYLDELAQRLGLARAELPAFAERHLAAMGALFVLGAEGLVLIASSRRRRLVVAGHVALIASVVGGSAMTIAGYVPTVKDRYVFPWTKAIEALQGALGDERVVFLSASGLAAELNLAYGVRTIESYDALGVADSLRLIGYFFGGDILTAEPRRASKRALELFGVPCVVTRGGWVPIDTDLGDLLVGEGRTNAYTACEWIVKGQVGWPQAKRDPTLRIELEASRDGLDGVAVQFLDDQAAMTSSFGYRLIDVDQDRELASGECRLGVLPLLPMIVPGGRCELVARFDPLPDSKGRKLALEITTTGEKGDPRPRVLRSPWARPDEPEVPIPMVDLGYGQSEFELVSKASDHSLYRYTRSPGRAWIVGTALAAATHEEAFDRVIGPAFEPLEQVVLERPGGAGGEATEHAGPFELEIQGEEPCRWRFAATCATPGWLVVAQAFYPGWKARIDGEERPVLRANYGLTAVELPAGRHEVVLEYDPPSVRIGAWCSAAAAALIALGVVLGPCRSRDAGRHPPAGPHA